MNFEVHVIKAINDISIKDIPDLTNKEVYLEESLRIQKEQFVKIRDYFWQTRTRRNTKNSKK
jgi:hypothetical protein